MTFKALLASALLLAPAAGLIDQYNEAKEGVAKIEEARKPCQDPDAIIDLFYP
jgi:hypothetical protein